MGQPRNTRGQPPKDQGGSERNKSEADALNLDAVDGEQGKEVPYYTSMSHVRMRKDYCRLSCIWLFNRFILNC